MYLHDLSETTITGNYEHDTVNLLTKLWYSTGIRDR